MTSSIHTPEYIDDLHVAIATGENTERFLRDYADVLNAREYALAVPAPDGEFRVHATARFDSLDEARENLSYHPRHRRKKYVVVSRIAPVSEEWALVEGGTDGIETREISVPSAH